MSCLLNILVVACMKQNTPPMLYTIRLDHERIISEYLSGKKTTEICKEFDCSLSRVHQILKMNNVPTPKMGEAFIKYSYNNEYFSVINTEEKAYWLGFIYADGCVVDSKYRKKYFQMALSNKDYSHLELFNKCIESTRPIAKHNKPSGKGSMCSYVIVSNQEFVKNLEKQGVVPRKTLILDEFPEIHNDLLHHFVRGYFDGDGSVFLSKERHHRSKKLEDIIHIRIMGTSKFLEKIIAVTDIATINCIKSHGSIYCIHIKRKLRCKEYYDYMYEGASVFLERKEKIFRDYFCDRHSETIIGNPEKD